MNLENWDQNSVRLGNSDFKAQYNYGPAAEQRPVDSKIKTVAQSIVLTPLKVAVFPGASILKNRLLDPVRIAEGRQQLQFIGAQELYLETPDGDTIHAIFLSAARVKEVLLQHFDYRERIDKNGETVRFLTLKPDVENVEAVKTSVKRLGFDILINGIISENPEVRGFVIALGKPFPPEVPTVQDNQNGSRPTVLIAAGSGMSAVAYKHIAISYILKGMDAMLFDYRGYGESKGTPTSAKTKLDIETAYQYLHQEKHVENSDLLVHGHCLGGGPASDLASRREGVNVILDRTFANYAEIAASKYPRISRVVEKVLPSIVNYDNAPKIERVTGHIAIVSGANDQMIPPEQTAKQVASLPDRDDKQQLHLHSKSAAHTGGWFFTVEQNEQFSQFLMQSHLVRSLF